LLFLNVEVSSLILLLYKTVLSKSFLLLVALFNVMTWYIMHRVVRSLLYILLELLLLVRWRQVCDDLRYDLDVWWVSLGFLIWYFHFLLFVYRSNAHFLFYLLSLMSTSNQFITQTIRVNSNRNCSIRFDCSSATCLVIFSFEPSLYLNDLGFIITVGCQASPVLLKNWLSFN